jgi:hypothetical protein
LDSIYDMIPSKAIAYFWLWRILKLTELTCSSALIASFDRISVVFFLLMSKGAAFFLGYSLKSLFTVSSGPSPSSLCFKDYPSSVRIAAVAFATSAAVFTSSSFLFLYSTIL